MSYSNKSQISRDYTCKSHSARPDRAELYRICPSKLSKRELEDLYFALLENNLELKHTNNGQQDAIKKLSTKVQRMSATLNNAQSKETKDCCVATKAIVSEQKDSIAELKSANERLSERIRVLNMRLCSAKQFLRRSPSGAQAAARCNRCSTATGVAASLKNSSHSALLTKRSEGNLQPSGSCECLDKDPGVSTSSVDTETQANLKPPSNTPCDENKCKTLMEELEQKIFNLEEELSNTHEEYSSRISRLEREVLDVRKENVLVRSEHIASEHELQHQTRRSSELVTNLRAAEANCNELTMQLSMEKRKVAELEMQLKTANMSNNVNNAPNTHTQQCTNDTKTDRDEIKPPKSSDDSGYMDANRSRDSVDNKGLLDRLNENLMKKISELELKLDGLKVSNASELAQEKRTKKSLNKDLYDVNIKQFDGAAVTAVGTEKKQDNVLKESEKNVTIATNTTEEPVRSKHNSLVFKSDDVSVLSFKSAVPTTQRQDVPSTSRENNERCDECKGSEKEICSEINCGKSTPNDSKVCNINPDQHNKLQIPGPIPTTSGYNVNAWNKNLFKRISIEVKTRNTQKYKTTKDDPSQENQTSDNSNKQSKDNVSRTNKYTNLNENGTKDKQNIYELTNTSTKVINFESTNDVKTKDEKSEKSTYCKDSPETYSLGTDSVINSRRCSCNEVVKANRGRIPKSMNKVQTANVAVACPMVSDQGAQAGDQLEFCASQARVCTCPSAKHRAVSMFRTCSGTLRFTTVDTGAAKFRACDCSMQQYSNASCMPKPSGGTQVDPATPNESPRVRRGSTTSDRGTHSIRPVSEAATTTRATCTDNTDCEISSMTDLPSEKEIKSPRPALSPGEDKATSTYTDSYTTPVTTDYGSLSEGELPTQSIVRRVSIGEKTKTNNAALAESSSQKMEAALQAITEELARCKQLLLSQKPQEPPKAESRDASVTAMPCARQLALRRAPAAQTIGHARAPKCIFTLHIGTIVLSDEAVLNSRNKTLMLTWRFHDQNLAMTRMRAGRVVLFDFSTEYDVQITNEFLDYMEHVCLCKMEMPLIICELGKQDEPFASCSLPLKEALSHPNRRVDMSLALVAGPQTPSCASALDALDAGDELGVLDLWCMLRAEPRRLSAVRRASPTPSVPTSSYSNATSNNAYNSRTLQRVAENKQRNGSRMSQDLNPTLAEQSTCNRASITRRKSQHVSEAPGRASALWSSQTEPGGPPAAADVGLQFDHRASITRRKSQHVSEAPGRASALWSSQTEPGGPPAAADVGLQFDASKYPTPRRQSQSMTTQRGSLNIAPVESPSGLIINEVAPSIKTPYDIKHALERNVNRNSLQSISRLPKSEDDLTSLQTHSSGTAIKTFITRLRKSQHAPAEEILAPRRDSDTTRNRNRSGKLIGLNSPPPKSYPEDEDNTEIYRKYENIIQTVGSNKPETSKKSVKIYPNYEEPSAEEPQKDITEDDRYSQSMSITVLWLALNEECEAMVNPRVQRLYVAYSFLGRSGAELETPVSLPKPKHYVDKCYFNFKKTFQLDDIDLPLLSHMARCRIAGKNLDSKDCIMFTVISEPPEDPLGLDNCEDIGYAYLCLGDLLAYSAGSAEYTEVVPVRAAKGSAPVCGVLAVRVAGLDVVRRCLTLAHSPRDGSTDIWATA